MTFTNKQTNKETNKQTNKQNDDNANKHEYGQEQTNKYMNKQTKQHANSVKERNKQMSNNTQFIRGFGLVAALFLLLRRSIYLLLVS